MSYWYFASLFSSLFCESFVFVFCLFLSFFKKEREKNIKLDEYEGKKDLDGNGGGEDMIRIYCIKNFNKKDTHLRDYFSV